MEDEDEDNVEGRAGRREAATEEKTNIFRHHQIHS